MALEKQKKKIRILAVLGELRGSSSSTSKSETEIEETLRSDHFQVCKTVCHGFPYQPTAVAFDPVQHLLAIGTKSGALRISQPAKDVVTTLKDVGTTSLTLL